MPRPELALTGTYFGRDPNGLGWFITTPTLTESLHGATRGLIESIRPDAVLNIESHAFNVIIAAGTCELNLDVGKHLWLNKQRWSRLIKEYVPARDVDRFIEQAQEIYQGEARDGATANMMFRDPVRYEKKHRWGGCLMGATFRGSYDANPTITLYSRTCYMGYIGMLDAAVAFVMSQYIADETVIAFRWHITSMQVHCFKTLPFIYSQPDLMDKVECYAGRTSAGALSPTWRNIAKWYTKVLEAYDQYGTAMLDHEKYGPFRRIKRRWLEYKGHLKKNVPPSLPVTELDFEKAE